MRFLVERFARERTKRAVQKFNGLGGSVLALMIHHQYIGVNHVVISQRARSFSTTAF
jgi:hypothetical protein